jgi:hypothetical protein
MKETSASSSSSCADTVLNSSARRGAFAVCLHALETMPLVVGAWSGRAERTGSGDSGRKGHGGVIKQKHDYDSGATAAGRIEEDACAG